MTPREPTGATIRCPRCGHAQELAFHYAQVPYNEQTSGPGEQPSLQARTGTGDAGPLDHQPAATSVSDGATAAPSEATASVTDPAADPLPVAWATPSLLVTMSAVEKRRLTSPEMRGRGGEWEADARDADRYSVPLYRADAPAPSAHQTARFDLAWLISAINVHRHLPRPVGPELPKWYAENDRWLREASEMLNKIYSAENTPGSAAQPAEPPARR